MPDNKEHRVDKETNVWRKIEKILGAPSHRIAWKFEEAGKIEACTMPICTFARRRT